MTAIEFMRKQLRKCEINLEREEQRGASEEVLQAIRDKIRFYGEAVEALGAVRCKDCRMAAMLRKPKGEVIADCMLRKFHTDDEDFIEVRGDDFCSYGVRREEDAV